MERIYARVAASSWGRRIVRALAERPSRTVEELVADTASDAKQVRTFVTHFQDSILHRVETSPFEHRYELTADFKRWLILRAVSPDPVPVLCATTATCRPASAQPSRPPRHSVSRARCSSSEPKVRVRVS